MWGTGVFIWPDGRKYKGSYVDDELQYLLEDLLEVVSTPGKNVLNELPKIRIKMEKR